MRELKLSGYRRDNNTVAARLRKETGQPHMVCTIREHTDHADGEAIDVLVTASGFRPSDGEAAVEAIAFSILKMMDDGDCQCPACGSRRKRLEAVIAAVQADDGPVQLDA